MLDMFDKLSMTGLFTLYGLSADVESKRFPLLAVIAEKIAGDERLKGLDGNRRKFMLDVNRIMLEDLIRDLDDAQEEYEKTVALPWGGFEFVALALFLHYATVAVLMRRTGSTDWLKYLVRSWQVDYTYLKRWNKSEDDTGEDEGQLTDAQKANRAKLYVGNSRGTFFQVYEQMKLLENAGKGWVAHYITRGDIKVCPPCNEAAGYYLLGQGPYPGRVCKGRARCRCKRVIEWNPGQYKLLISNVDVTNGWTW